MQKKRIFAMIIAFIVAVTCLMPVTAIAGSKKVSKPAKPAWIDIDCYNGQVDIVWATVKGATKYKVYYRKKGASKWKSVAAVPASETMSNVSIFGIPTASTSMSFGAFTIPIRSEATPL